MTEKFGGEIGKKYAGIDLSGKFALKNNKINSFSYSPEILKQRFVVVAKFDELSEEILQAEILSEIEKIENKYDIKLIITKRDFPIHTTITDGTLNEPDESQYQSEKKFNSDEFKQLAETRLNGVEIEFKYLLIDKGNLILTSVDIPDEVTKTRNELTKKYESSGFKPISLTNILHVSLSRMTELPEDETKKEIFDSYKKDMIKLRHKISANPLKLKIGDIYAGDTYSLLMDNDEKK